MQAANTTPLSAPAYTLEGPAGAPVLMFSNSLGTTMSLWEQQAAALRGQYRILRYDTHGHGRSANASGPVTLAQLGQDVLDLLDSLQLDKVSFCGISMGGLIGLWLGVHAGERLQRLIVANTAAKIGSADAWRSRAEQVVENGMDGVADGAAGRWFTPAFIAREPALVAGMIGQLRVTATRGYAACCLALADADLRDRIAAIHAPTLVVAGRDDPVTTLADAHFLQQNIVGATGLELAASHLSNLEASHEFSAGLEKFLS